MVYLLQYAIEILGIFQGSWSFEKWQRSVQISLRNHFWLISFNVTLGIAN